MNFIPRMWVFQLIQVSRYFLLLCAFARKLPENFPLQAQNKHLLQLSKDRNLEEREKLQLQLSDMNYKMQQQQETIQVTFNIFTFKCYMNSRNKSRPITLWNCDFSWNIFLQLLRRKLALETKSLKHQLHVEISKHKETQKNLQETIAKLKSLECLLDNREKRMYYNGQLSIYGKEKNLGSHSLTNLRDVRYNNRIYVSFRLIIQNKFIYVYVFYISASLTQSKHLAEVKGVKMVQRIIWWACDSCVIKHKIIEH